MLVTNLALENYKAAAHGAMNFEPLMKIRLAQSIFRPDVKPFLQVTNQNKGSCCLLFHDQSERSPDSGLDADELTNNCIRRIFFFPHHYWLSSFKA